MATATVTISGGGRVAANRSAAVVMSVGAGVGIGSVAWGGASAIREQVPWLPSANVRVVNPSSGLMEPVWYRFFKELAENRLGGKNGRTLPQVVTTVEQTQTQVVATSAQLTETIAYARSVDETATVLRQVAIDNALSGAGTVPEPSEPPPGTTP